jgi:hypothetical protein
MKVAPAVRVLGDDHEQASIVAGPQPLEEDVELTWKLYCGPSRSHGWCRHCDWRVCCSQLRRDYREHNRVSILCHGVQYGVFCFLLAGLVAFFVWFAGKVL